MATGRHRVELTREFGDGQTDRHRVELTREFGDGQTDIALNSLYNMERRLLLHAHRCIGIECI